MGSFTRGDIVTYPFPYTDLTDTKVRPCLVISNEINQDIILCQITSQNFRNDKSSVEIRENETIKGTLNMDSYARPHMLFTADKSDIIKKICKVKDKKYSKIINKIVKIIFK